MRISSRFLVAKKSPRLEGALTAMAVKPPGENEMAEVFVRPGVDQVDNSFAAQAKSELPLGSSEMARTGDDSAAVSERGSDTPHKRRRGRRHHSR